MRSIRMIRAIATKEASERADEDFASVRIPKRTTTVGPVRKMKIAARAGVTGLPARVTEDELR